MVKHLNRKPKSGTWSKYNPTATQAWSTATIVCEHWWLTSTDSGLADGWQRCQYCDLVRMTPGQLEVLSQKTKDYE